MDGIEAYLGSLRKMGSKMGLSRMERLLSALGDPQDAFHSIIVGGSSGKGSTSAMLASILMEAGYRTALYTSPHLSSLRERIRVDGEEIDGADLTKGIASVREAIAGMEKDPGFDHPTYFEVMTVVAFLHFRDKGARIAVLEVGLGGRLDATNTVEPLVSVISAISLEHTDILGSTIELIASEKAGIARKGGVLVCGAGGPALDVIRGRCAMIGSRIRVLGEDFTAERTGHGEWGSAIDFTSDGSLIRGLRIPLMGGHQVRNAGCAVEASLALREKGMMIPEEAIRKGLSSVSWPGRMEIVSRDPPVMLDCAKDPDAMRNLSVSLEGIGWEGVIVVMAVSSDKDIGAMIDAIAPRASSFIASRHSVRERSTDPQALADHARRHGKAVRIAGDMHEALMMAIGSARREGRKALVTGSVFAVGDAREVFFPRKDRFGRGLNDVLKGF